MKGGSTYRIAPFGQVLDVVVVGQGRQLVVLEVRHPPSVPDDGIQVCKEKEREEGCSLLRVRNRHHVLLSPDEHGVRQSFVTN